MGAEPICHLAVRAEWDSAATAATTTTAAGTTSTTTTSTGGISVGSFDRDFTAMAQLRSLVPKGKGGITAIMPDTVSSTRYVEFDAPYLTRAMRAAGLSASEITVAWSAALLPGT